MESISLQEGDGIAPEGWESACNFPDAGLVRLSTPSLPAAETSAPRGLPHRKVTEKVTLISEPATESSLTPAPD